MSRGSLVTKSILTLTILMVVWAAQAQVPGTAPFAFFRRNAFSTQIAGGYLYVQERSASGGGSTAVSTADFLQSTTTGNLIVCKVYYNDDARSVISMTDSASNTYQRAVGPADLSYGEADVWYAYNITGGSNFSVTGTFDATVPNSTIECSEYSGVQTSSDPLDEAVFAVGTAVPASSGFATISGTPRLILGIGENASCILDGGTGFTVRAQPNCNLIEDRIANNGSSYEVTFNAAGNEWAAFLLAFKLSGDLPVVDDTSDGTIAGTNSSTQGSEWEPVGTDWWGISWMGEWEVGSRQYGYFRFQIPSGIPSGSLVESATIKIWQNGSYNWNSGSDGLRVWVQNTPNASAVDEKTDYPGDAGGTILSTSSMRWPASGGLSWGDQAYITSPSFHAVLQEVVNNQGGISAGDHIQVWIAADSIASDHGVSFIDSTNTGDVETNYAHRPPQLTLRFNPPSHAGPPTKLKLAGPTSLNTGVCSSVFYVRTLDANNKAANATSNVTVNLTSNLSGTFYSDSTCSNSVTSVQIDTGTNVASFYFKNNTSQTVNLTATDNAAGLTSDTLSTVVVSYRAFTWLGGGGNSNWTTAANWSNNQAPSWGDTVYFDSNCSSCNATIDTNIQPAFIKMIDGYVGTITQGNNTNITLGLHCGVSEYPGLVQTSGTWASGTNTSATIIGGVKILGGTHTPATVETIYDCGVANIAAAGYAPTTGKITGTGDVEFIWNGQTINNLWLRSSEQINSHGTVTINGNLELGDAGSSIEWFCGGTFNLKGNLIFNEVNVEPCGDFANLPIIKFIGTSPQTWTGSTGEIGHVEFASSGGVTLPATAEFGGDFVVTSGSVTLGTSVVLRGAFETYETTAFNPGSLAFTDLTIAREGTLTVTGNITVNGNLTFNANLDGNGTMAVNGGNFNVTGNVVGTNYGEGTVGNTDITFVGTNAQTWSNSNGNPPSGEVTINKASGTVTLSSAFTLSSGQDLLVSSGILDLNTRNLLGNPDLIIANGATVKLGGSQSVTANVTPQTGSLVEYTGTTFTGLRLGNTYSNLKFSNSGTGTLNAALLVNGNLEVAAGTLAANSRTITLGGNWSQPGGSVSWTSGTVTFSDANHTITGNSQFRNINNAALTASRTFTFSSGNTHNISAGMTLVGSAGNMLLLRSSSPGNQFTIAATTSVANDYLDVQDSAGSTLTSAGINGVLSGNTTNWYIPLSINTSVARVTGTPADNNNITTASFTPPNNSLLLVFVSADTADASTDITIAVSDSTGLTWTNAVERDPGDGSTQAGHQSAWWAKVTTGTSMTVSAMRTTSGGSTNRISFKTYVITNHDQTTPIGAVAEGSSTTNNLTTTSVTTTATYSRVFGGADEWNALGVPVSTDTEEAATHPSQISVISAYKAADTPAASTAVTMNFDAFSTGSAAWNWVLVEVKRTP